MANKNSEVTTIPRDMILSGQLAHGERIKESSRAKSLGVSRTSIRLALAVLEKDNLVEGIPNKGFSVRVFTEAYKKEILSIRATLEGTAARLSAEIGVSTDRRAILMNCIRRKERELSSEFVSKNIKDQILEFDKVFHKTILICARSQLIEDIIDQKLSIPGRSKLLSTELSAEQSVNEFKFSIRDHKVILDAILSGAGSRAEFAIREHILNSR